MSDMEFHDVIAQINFVFSLVNDLLWADCESNKHRVLFGKLQPLKR